MIQTTKHFEIFEKKPSNVFVKALTPVKKKFLQLNQLFDAKLPVRRLSFSSVKNYGSLINTCNKVKKCSKPIHDKPRQSHGKKLHVRWSFANDFMKPS